MSLQASYSDLQRALLLGTDNYALAQETMQDLATLGIGDADSPHDTMLDGVASLGLMRQSAPLTRTWDEALPDAPDLTHEWPHFSDEAARLWFQITRGKRHEGVLPEFLYLLNRKQRSFPPHLLPQLLDKLAADDTLADTFPLLIGARGQWLVAQKPSWTSLIWPPNIHDWQMASTEKRLKILRYLITAQPAAALALLTEDWSKFQPAFRKKVLVTLQRHPLHAAEAWLEQCLSEKDIAIRQAAAMALTQLPNSALTQRMIARANSGDTALKASDIRDGFDKNNTLSHLFTCLPPSFWADKPQPLSDPEVVIAHIKSCIFHNDMAALAGILPLIKATPAVMSAIEDLPPARYHELLAALSTQAMSPDLLMLIATSTHFWSAAFTKDILENHLTRLKQPPSALTERLVKHFLLRTPPDQADIFLYFAVQNRWLYQIDSRTEDLLAFRKKMHLTVF